MSSCDWFSTKKRGKDDKQIDRDSRQALEEKKQKRNIKKKGSAGAGVGAMNSVKSRRRKESSYDDDDYSEEGFIVHDDDEEDFKEESEGSFDSGMDDDDSDDDDDVVLHDDDDSDDSVAEVIDITTSSRNSRASRRKKTENGIGKDVLSIDSSSSDSERESFLPTGVARQSTPSKLLKKNSNSANRRFNASLEASSSMNADKKKRKKSVDSLMQLKPPVLKKSKRPIAKYDKCESNDDDEELISPCSNGNNRSNSKDDIHFEEVFSSDEESNKSIITRNKPRATGTDGGRYVQQKTQEKTFVLDIEDSDDEVTNIQQLPSQYKKEIPHSLEDTPEPTNKKRRRLKKKGTKMNAKKGKGKIRATNKYSSDEDEMSIVDNGGFNEEDINVAMRESVKDSEKKKTNYETILHESSSDDEDEDEDQGDAYVDHEKETATNVLRTAENLSSNIVRAMSGWFNNDKDSSSSNPVQGIIMDGAVSLGNLDGGEFGSDDSEHKWISNSEMCEACPNVTLSKYQLIGTYAANTYNVVDLSEKVINLMTHLTALFVNLNPNFFTGVNWLALLNGMNVNGVLADEMGLVCNSIYIIRSLVLYIQIDLLNGIF